MNVDSAIELVRNLVYKPGWSFEARDHTNRFEGSIKVKVTYPARNSNRDQAELGYPEEITTYAEFAMVVAFCDDTSLYRKIARAITEIEVHEMREFLRVKPTFWAPFHPHRIDGMKRWSTSGTFDPTEDVFSDLQFGVA